MQFAELTLKKEESEREEKEREREREISLVESASSSRDRLVPNANDSCRYQISKMTKSLNQIRAYSDRLGRFVTYLISGIHNHSLKKQFAVQCSVYLIT